MDPGQIIIKSFQTALVAGVFLFSIGDDLVIVRSLSGGDLFLAPRG
jgi:hypothetical protein